MDSNNKQYLDEFTRALNWLFINMKVLTEVIDKYIPNHLNFDYSFNNDDIEVIKNILMPRIDKFADIFYRYLTAAGKAQDKLEDEYTDKLLEGLEGCYNHIVDVYEAVEKRIEEMGSS